MTFAELMSTTPVERWASLSVATRDAIGAKLLESHFAELVQDDDGLETTEQERIQAGRIQDRAFNELFPMIEAAFPAVMWSYPTPVTYEARDRHDALIGTVEHGSTDMWWFKPVSPTRRQNNMAKYGVPFDSLPQWARRAVARGGWFGAVFEDGTRYPDDYRDTTPGPTSALARAA